MLGLSCQHLFSKKYRGAAAKADEMNLTGSFCLPFSSASSALCKRKVKPSSCQVEREAQHQVAYSWSPGSGCSCWGGGPGPGPGHILSLCRGLARHSVLSSRPKARVLGLRSQIIVLWGWMTIRNAQNNLSILQEEFYLASSSWRPFNAYNKSWDMGKSYGIAEGYIKSTDHCLGI